MHLYGTRQAWYARSCVQILQRQEIKEVTEEPHIISGMRLHVINGINRPERPIRIVDGTNGSLAPHENARTINKSLSMTPDNAVRPVDIDVPRLPIFFA